MAESTGRAASGTVARISLARMESIGADVDITGGPYVSRITGYNLAIDLAPGNFTDGNLKKIYNDSGSEVVIDSTIEVQGAATDKITLASGAGSFVKLLYLNSADVTERWRDIDSVGLTLS